MQKPRLHSKGLILLAFVASLVLTADVTRAQSSSDGRKHKSIASRLETLSKSVRMKMKSAFGNDSKQPTGQTSTTQADAAAVHMGNAATQRAASRNLQSQNAAQQRLPNQGDNCRCDPNVQRTNPMANDVAQLRELAIQRQSTGQVQRVGDIRPDGLPDHPAGVVTQAIQTPNSSRRYAGERQIQHIQNSPMSNALSLDPPFTPGLGPNAPPQDTYPPEPTPSYRDAPYVGARLPAANITATERALRLKQENDSLKASQTSMSSANKQLRDQLQMTRDLLRRTEVAMDRAQSELENAEKQNAQLKNTIAKMKIEHSPFAAETTLMLDAIRDELDSTLVSEINDK